jgi:hypothetical protein
MTTNDNILSRELEAEKTADGKESLTMTIKAPTLGGGGGGAGPNQDCRGDGEAAWSSITGWTDSCHRSDRSPIPVKLAHDPLDDIGLSSRRVQRRGGGRQMREDLNTRSSGAS